MSRRLNILLVEDHDDTRELMTIALNEFGYFVSAVASINEAARLLASQWFDLFVIDSRLPDGTGLQLCQQIRRKNERSPIVFCSADSYSKQINEAFEAGVQVYITKPFELDQFQKTINQLLTVSSY